MAGRFSKILEFIGLVDDDPDDGERDGRPIPNQPYVNQTRRPSQASTRRDYYEDRRQSSTPPRPDYDARQRRNDQQRYQQRPPQDYRQGYDYRAPAPYQQQPSAYQPGYQPSYQSGYQSSSAYERDRTGYDKPARPQLRAVRGDTMADEFDMMDKPQRNREREMAPELPARSVEPSRETVIYYLRQLEECRDVINDLLNNKTVLLNLEDMDERIVQRAIDTLCGAAFALDATLRKASDKTYLIAPGTMQVASTRDTERRFT